MSEQLETALNLVAGGISVIPVGANKVPRIAWREYLTRLPTEDELEAWFGTGGLVGVGRVCGAVSGNLETIDFDVDDEVDRNCLALDASGLLTLWREQVERAAPGLVDRLTLIRTPRPGWHVVYRCAEPVDGNQKLAFVPMARSGWKAIIETRGEGGYCLHPGSPGGCHPSGGTYAHVRGPAIESAEPISADERLILLQAARLFNQKPEASEKQARFSDTPIGTSKPGDDFNERATWAEILEPHGFERTGGAGDCEHWKRPGTSNQLSLTCNFDGSGYLYAFSPNCGFEPNRGYSKFAAYAILNHAGDFGAAATALGAAGYGVRSEPAITVASEDELPATACAAKPPAFPVDRLGVPGIIQAITEHTAATSYVRQPALALGAAVALMGTIIGRKVRDPSGTCANIYVIGLCRSGGGKERARQVNTDLLYLAGHAGMIGPEGFASGAGVVTAVAEAPDHRVLFQVDEIGRMLNTIKRAGGQAGHLASIPTTLMRLYTSSASIYKSDAYAEGAKKNREIVRPNACLYGTSVPENFWGSLTRDSLTDGFVSRLLIIEGDDDARPEVGAGVAISEPPDDVVQLVKHWCEYAPPVGNLAGAQGHHVTIPYTEAGSSVMDAFQAEVIDLQFGAGEVKRALWSRAIEKARKLALIYACSANHLQPVIDDQACEWAAAVTRFLTERVIRESGRRISENITEDNFKRLYAIIEEAGRIDASALCKRSRWLKRRDREEIIGEMIGEGIITCAIIPTATKTRTVYQTTT